MAKLFDTVDAERLIQEHRMMLEELDEIAQYEDNVQMDIEKAANLVVTRNVLDVLRDIPVEEINREKGGFRVKALRDHGFRSIADIVVPMCIRLVRCIIEEEIERIKAEKDKSNEK